MLTDRGFWYVGFLAVDTACQGQGVGSIMLQYAYPVHDPSCSSVYYMILTCCRTVLDKADREDMQVYLETGNPRNVPWYEKFGFVKVYMEKAGFVGPTVYYMRRCHTTPSTASSLSFVLKH